MLLAREVRSSRQEPFELGPVAANVWFARTTEKSLHFGEATRAESFPGAESGYARQPETSGTGRNW